MKWIKIGFLVFFLITVLSVPVAAQEKTQDEINQEMLQEQYELSGADELMGELPEGVDEQLEENGIDSPTAEEVTGFSIGDFFRNLWTTIVDTIKSPLILLAASFGVILLCALFKAFDSTVNPSLSSVLNVVATLAICGVLLTPVMHCIDIVSTCIRGMGDFLLCFIPVFTGLVGLSGAPAAALGYNTALFGLAQVISVVTTSLLLPFIGVFLALSICCSISGQFDIGSLTATVRKVVVWGLTLMVTIFVGLFAVQNMVAVSTDSLTVRTAKFMSGSFVPVVGNALGDAVGSVFGCLGIIKASVGSFGIIVCLLTFLPPIFLVLFYMLAVKLSDVASNVLGVKGVSTLLTSVYDALSILLAFVICYAVLTIVTTTIMISISTG